MKLLSESQWESCPYCPNIGIQSWWVHYQCEFCYTVPESVFYQTSNFSFRYVRMFREMIRIGNIAITIELPVLSVLTKLNCTNRFNPLNYLEDI